LEHQLVAGEALLAEGVEAAHAVTFFSDTRTWRSTAPSTSGLGRPRPTTLCFLRLIQNVPQCGHSMSDVHSWALPFGTCTSSCLLQHGIVTVMTRLPVARTRSR